MKRTLLSSVLLGILCGLACAGDANPFFAMDTIARGRPPEVIAMLRELGYAGLGGQAGDGDMAMALEESDMKFFNGYLTLEFSAERPALDEKLRRQIDAMQGHHSALWLAVAKVNKEGQAFAKSSPEGDETVLSKLREIADYSEARGVWIALYPHAGSWLERVQDAIRLADKLNRPSVGVTFNLCHWLKVEGSERDPVPVLRAALPRLMFITINGADTGDTMNMGWDRLIRPLGDGTYDVGALVRSARTLGYTGPFGFQGYGIKADPREVLTRTMAAWRRF